MASTSAHPLLPLLTATLEEDTFIKLWLTSRRDPIAELKGIIATLVQLKKGLRLQLVYRYQTKDVTKNYALPEGVELILEALQHTFYNAELYTKTEDVTFTSNAKGQSHLRRKAPSMQQPLTLAHDRVKERAISTSGNTYMRELGITNAQGELRREMNDKYRQINRYVELLAPYFRDLDELPEYHIADMGSGKGYLTFALYDYLIHHQPKPVHIIGVEFRLQLVDTCNAIAGKAGFEHLRFVQGTIEQVEIPRLDVLIALHACNTATDEAIYRGVRAGAALIVCAPCCHKQVRQDFHLHGPLAQLLKHGILQERQAEIVTDGLRALIMEAHGYKTSVFEFISTEHTPKNVMIVGRKCEITPARRQEILNTIDLVKQQFGLDSHYLQQLLDSK